MDLSEDYENRDDRDDREDRDDRLEARYDRRDDSEARDDDVDVRPDQQSRTVVDEQQSRTIVDVQTSSSAEPQACATQAVDPVAPAPSSPYDDVAVTVVITVVGGAKGEFVVTPVAATSSLNASLAVTFKWTSSATDGGARTETRRVFSDAMPNLALGDVRASPIVRAVGRMFDAAMALHHCIFTGITLSVRNEYGSDAHSFNFASLTASHMNEWERPADACKPSECTCGGCAYVEPGRTTLLTFFFSTMVAAQLGGLLETSRTMAKARAIEGKADAVSKEPLDLSAVRLPCGHMYNFATWRRLVKAMAGACACPGSHGMVRCPLCRADSAPHEVEVNFV